MDKAVYLMCAILSVLCALLLFRGYRRGRSRLLMWSSLAFMMLALNNIILFTDLVILPQVDFGGGLLRNLTGAMGGVLLLFGLIWEVT
jgi:hypothetical protein